MTALELISLLSQVIYVLLFVVLGYQALRRPSPARIDIVLFFAAAAVVIVETRLVQHLGLEQTELLLDIVVIVFLAMPYFLLRLVADFSGVPGRVKRIAELGLLLVALPFLLTTGTPQPLVVLAIVLYFTALSLYGAVAFARATRGASGVTRRRLEAIAAGSVLLGVAILVGGLAQFVPEVLAGFPNGVVQSLALASAVAYFVGFAPPGILRRAWQEPELRAFLRRAASLPRLPDTAAIVTALQDGSASTLGARATIGLYDKAANVLRFQDPHDVLPPEVGASRFLAWRVFERQRAEYFPDAARAHPELADSYRQRNVASLLIAPISAGDERLGVLEAYTDRQPIFSEDDLKLAQLLADQAAVILESRALIDEASQVRAHEEATRLKDDFISAAAHDLKTPLTTLVAQAQFLERRAQQNPSAPADVGGLNRIVREAKRLSGLVMELLDASRLEQGKLLGEREPVDLVELARDVASRDSYRTHQIKLVADAPVVGSYDPRRIGQVIENLIDNAVKYSPEKSDVRVRIAQRDGLATLDVADDGIGIPAPDLRQVFERFHRASNVDDRRFAGMGLGLFICRGIVEQHGGQIWVESQLGSGSTFHVTLPLGSRP